MTSLHGRSPPNCDIVEAAIAAFDRRDFLPYAHDDLDVNKALPIGSGQTLTAVDTVRSILCNLPLNSRTTAVEFGAGTGYFACVLSYLMKEVVSFDVDGILLDHANRMCAKYKRRNLRFERGDFAHHETITAEYLFVSFAVRMEAFENIISHSPAIRFACAPVIMPGNTQELLLFRVNSGQKTLIFSKKVRFVRQRLSNKY